MIKRKTAVAIQGSVLYILFFVIGLGRIRNSFDHLPVDPGYEFFADTYRYGISALVKTEGGYLDIPRRIIAEVVTLFPIHYTGNVGSMIWLLMVSAIAVFIAAMAKRIHPSKVLAIACGACVVLAPSARESQIGNQSVVKWFLILIAIIVVSLPEEDQLSARTTAILVLLSGLSNPMTFLAAAPLGASLLQRKLNLKDSRTKLILGAFIVGFVIQLVSWKTTGVGVQKYDSLHDKSVVPNACSSLIISVESTSHLALATSTCSLHFGPSAKNHPASYHFTEARKKIAMLTASTARNTNFVPSKCWTV